MFFENDSLSRLQKLLSLQKKKKIRKDMKNRFNLIFALILVLLGGNCLSLWGQNWGSDFSIPERANDRSTVPGNSTYVYEKFADHTWFRIPRYGD